MIETLLIAAAGVNRLTEVAKKFLATFDLDDNIRKFILLAFTLGAGIVTVAASNSALNLFAGTWLDRFPPVVSIVLTGMAVGLGADFLHLIADLMQALKRPNILEITAEELRGHE